MPLFLPVAGSPAFSSLGPLRGFVMRGGIKNACRPRAQYIPIQLEDTGFPTLSQKRRARREKAKISCTEHIHREVLANAHRKFLFGKYYGKREK
jgi:hypothetical protein